MFPAGHLESAVVGHLAFACEDISQDLSRVVFDPFGRNQPDLNKLLEYDAYTLDAYLVLRRAFLERAIRSPFGTIDYNKIVRLAAETEPVYADLAKNGTEHSVKQALGEMVDTKRHFFLFLPNLQASFSLLFEKFKPPVAS